MASSPPKQFPSAHSSSSAFSANANPDEDWTKISDLAERRRIQNRIAQRNYRKKLKKRMEDLERRASTDSGSPEAKIEELESPEQKPIELARPVRSPPSSSVRPGTDRRRSTIQSSQERCTPDVLTQQYTLPVADRGMFSQQYTRQLSTSPPPFSYHSFAPPNRSHNDTYCGSNPVSIDMSYYPQYMSTAPYVAATGVKHEAYGDDDLSPFAMSYASMAGMDVSNDPSYRDFDAYTPPLRRSFELAGADSPPESILMTPPLFDWDHF